MFTPLLLSLAALAPTSDDAPDLVTLTEGKALEGRVLYEDDARVVVRVKRRERELPREEVAELQTIERSLRAYLDAYDRTPHDDTAALAGLARSCEDGSLFGEARALWIRILLLDPENEEAWTRLGGVKNRKGWRIKVRGRYYTLEQLRERTSDWKNALELPTAHFLIRSDLDPARTLDIALNAERAYLAYYDLLGPVLGLYVFDEIPEIHLHGDPKTYPTPPNPRGAWYSFGENTLHVDASRATGPQEAVANLTYALIQNSFHRTHGKSGRLDPWARHGLSEIFGSAVRQDDEGVLSWDFGTPVTAFFRAQAGDEESLTLKQLLRAGRASFDSGPDAQRYSVQAYTLMYFLAHVDDGAWRGELGAYLQSSYAGKGSTSHFEKIFGAKLEDVEARWNAYVAELAG